MSSRRLAAHCAALFPSRRAPRTRCVGLEQELITRDAADGSVVPIERVRRAATSSSYATSLGFEPGGQVELSLPWQRTIAGLGQGWRRAVGDLRSDCAAAGVVIETTPLDPRGPAVPLQLRSARYVGMQEHFDRIGPAGRRMMRLTASTQVCLDWWPGADGLEQWQLMQLAGPYLAASFQRGHGPGSRLSTWLAVDPGRTAFDDRLLGPDPIGAYADFAMGAEPFSVPADAGTEVVHHLSTLFPPVRPRGRYLEVRHLDAQPDVLVPVVAAALAVLLYDDDCRRRALALVVGDAIGLGELWRVAADAPAELGDRSGALMAVVLEGIPRAPTGYLPAGTEAAVRRHLEAHEAVGAA